METNKNDETTVETKSNSDQPLSKNAQKRLKKQQQYEVRKAQKKALEKEHRQKEGERKRREWEEKLSGCENEEEKQKLIESRKVIRKERMEERAIEKEKKNERLSKAIENGQKIVIDLDFAHLMTSSELHSLVQQIMYCYAVNGRCSTPVHLYLTGCQGEMQNQLQRLPGYDKWVMEKESRPYIEAFENEKEKLVYLTADSETILDEFDLNKIYIIGGLVDRNRWKGITMNKAEEQGIQTAKLPIGNFLKMSSSQVLTVNQVVEIVLKFLETKDWKTSFFAVIPQRKRCEVSENEAEVEVNEEEKDDQETKRLCIETKSIANVEV